MAAEPYENEEGNIKYNNYPYGSEAFQKDIFGGQDIKGFYVYDNLRLYSTTTIEYTYYFSNQIEGDDWAQ